MEKQGEDMASWILGLLDFATRNRRVAATGHRVTDLTVGGCNDRVALPNRPEMALPAFLDVALRTYCGGSDGKVSAPGGRRRVSVCQSVV